MESWVDQMEEVQKENPILLMIYSSISILSGAGFGDNGAKLIHEYPILMAYFVLGTLVFSFLVADYSAFLDLYFTYR